MRAPYDLPPDPPLVIHGREEPRPAQVAEVGVVAGCSGVWTVVAVKPDVLEIRGEDGRHAFVAVRAFTRLRDATDEQVKQAGVTRI